MHWMKATIAQKGLSADIEKHSISVCPTVFTVKQCWSVADV